MTSSKNAKHTTAMLITALVAVGLAAGCDHDHRDEPSVTTAMKAPVPTAPTAPTPANAPNAVANVPTVNPGALMPAPTTIAPQPKTIKGPTPVIVGEKGIIGEKSSDK